MESREEIIKGKTYLSLIKGEQKIVLIHDDVINVMQEYSDQQNKQLLEEIERLNSSLLDVARKSCARVDELTAKLKDADSVNERYIDFISLVVNSYKMINNKTTIESVYHILTNRASDLLTQPNQPK